MGGLDSVKCSGGRSWISVGLRDLLVSRYFLLIMFSVSMSLFRHVFVSFFLHFFRPFFLGCLPSFLVSSLSLYRTLSLCLSLSLSLCLSLSLSRTLSIPVFFVIPASIHFKPLDRVVETHRVRYFSGLRKRTMPERICINQARTKLRT